MMDLKEFSDKKICVAVSGGVDSVVLLHKMKTLEKSCGFILSAAHCEHGIRGDESVEDMRFVQEFCKALGVELHLFSMDCVAKAKREKKSLETAARDFRYACFARLIEEKKADYIATAHHLDDEAETVLFRLARGTSLTGVRGMSEKSGYLLRPLLGLNRKEIEAYATENGLSYRVDKTNFSLDATRNKLRLQVLPKLNEAIEGASENLAKFALLAAEDDDLLYEYAETLASKIENNENKKWLVAFCDKPSLFKRACLLVMKKMGVERDYTAAHLDSLFGLQTLERGARICLPQNIRAEKTEKGVVFFEETEDLALPCIEETPFDENGFDGGRYEVKVSFAPFNEKKTEWNVLKIDADKLPENAVFRFRKEGDEIQTFGGRKTLKKFFNERKIEVKERAWLPLIAQKGGDKVFVVCGVEIAEILKITEETKRIAYIKIQKKREV